MILPQPSVDLVVVTVTPYRKVVCADYLSVKPFYGGEDVSQSLELYQALTDTFSFFLGHVAATALTLFQELGSRRSLIRSPMAYTKRGVTYLLSMPHDHVCDWIAVALHVGGFLDQRRVL